MRHLLIDGNHLASRCRHAHTDLRTSYGARSGVVYGVIQGISYVRNTLKLGLESVWVCWDNGRAAWRKLLFPGYKHRDYSDATPEQLQEQCEYANQLEALQKGLASAGVRQVRVEGCEADDLISLLAHALNEDGTNVIIYSGDHDMHQLCGIAQIFDPKRELLAKEDVLALHDVNEPELILLRKALMGDDSDKIPGVKQIGDKRSRSLVRYVKDYFLSDGMWGDVPDSKTAKLVAKVLADEELVRRNLQLMKLPASFSDPPYYTNEQADSFYSQIDEHPTQKTLAFATFLRSWELDSVKLERW